MKTLCSQINACNRTPDLCLAALLWPYCAETQMVETSVCRKVLTQ